MAVTLYGIKNCDTVRRARKWLEGQGVDYRFHDFRADGLDAELAKLWLAEIGPDTLINRRGTTWRKLPDEVRTELDGDKAAALIISLPTLIKRPVIDNNGRLTVGFTDQVKEGLSR